MTEPLRTILFDLDGTLLDTAPDMIGALNALRLEHGLAPLPYDSVRTSVSHGAARLVKLAFPEADPAAFAVLHKRFLEIYGHALSVHTRLFPGMDRVLAALAHRRLLCGIVTNKPAWLTVPLLDQLGLTATFVCVVSGDTVSHSKPHPMPMLHAAKLAGVAAGQCLYVGDAERDIQAAHAAGMQGVVAAYGYLQPEENWQAWGGDGVIRMPLDLLPWLEHSGRL
ncbi:MAG: putative 2-phosphoglycolate phosphatase [Gammaproteobacteria bacterium]|nr:putative 2-phosphoglycolate phosphatase [Gammaproteobacteria bacterium]